MSSVSISFPATAGSERGWIRWEYSFYDYIQHSPTANRMKNYIAFWIQPLWQEVVHIDERIEGVGINILEPKVPYFIHSREIRKRKLYQLTAMTHSHFLEVYNDNWTLDKKSGGQVCRD